MQNSTLYLQRLRQLLQMEYDSEKEEFRTQSEKMGIKRKIHRGICWYPVEAGRSYYNSLNQFVVEIVKKDHEEDEEDIEHLFEYGKPCSSFPSRHNTSTMTLRTSQTFNTTPFHRQFHT